MSHFLENGLLTCVKFLNTGFIYILSFSQGSFYQHISTLEPYLKQLQNGVKLPDKTVGRYRIDTITLWFMVIIEAQTHRYDYSTIHRYWKWMLIIQASVFCGHDGAKDKWITVLYCRWLAGSDIWWVASYESFSWKFDFDVLRIKKGNIFWTSLNVMWRYLW